jgi:hypothetical protein
MAARAALRVLPLVLRVNIQRSGTGLPILSAFRAIVVAWTAAAGSKKYPQNLSAAAVDAAQNADLVAGAMINADAAAVHALVAAVHAAVAVGAGDVASTNAANTFGMAASAVEAAGAAANVVWEALEADANWLLRTDNPDMLLVQPLWLTEVRERSGPDRNVNFPLWAREPFDAFDKSEWAALGPWGVWLAWYRGLLSKSANSKQVDSRRMFEIASQESAFWEGDPHRVTARVAALMRWKWNESRWRWPDERHESAPPVETSPPLQVIETVGIHSDEATTIDQLRRRPFAKAIVERLDDVFAQNGVDGFAIHIHAPWGAGKSSVLQMMRQYLETADRENKGKVAPRWVVVNFDAWKNERRNPPWWPLVQVIRTSCLAYARVFNEAGFIKLRWFWFRWKMVTDFLPYVVGALVAALAISFLWYAGDQPSSSGLLENALKVVAAATAIVASFIGASRVAMFGSSTNLKFYEDISQDPLQRIRVLFETIVNVTNAPICVFIEDLDRCRPDYVIGLLQGIQTVFRHRNVAYVIAADRSWVKASFENQYKDLKGEVGTPGQPLGYLFLEKIFQMSIPLPSVDARTRAEYWSSLLAPSTGKFGADGSERMSSTSEAAVDAERADIRGKTSNLTRQAAESLLKQNDTPVVREALALELSSSPAVASEATHLLSEFKDSVPEIPRVMKRMINAYAIRYAMGFMAGTDVPVKTLARWTIIEQSTPALADLLTLHPEWVEEKAQIPDSNPFSEELKSKRFRAIAGTGSDRLTAERIRMITRGEALVGPTVV